jgi:hypothetical protein
VQTHGPATTSDFVNKTLIWSPIYPFLKFSSTGMTLGCGHLRQSSYQVCR